MNLAAIWAAHGQFIAFDFSYDTRISEGLFICRPPPSPSLSGVPKNHLLAW